MKSVRKALLGSLALVAALAMGVAHAPRAAHGDVKSGEKALNEALKKGNDAAAVQAACDELIAAGGREAVNVLLKTLSKLRPDTPTETYWQLIGGTSGFPDKGALEEVGKFILANQKAPLGKDLLFGLQNNHSNYVTVPLQMVLEKGSYDLQLMAVDQLGNVRTSDTVDILLAALKKEKDAELKRRIDAALQCVTGEDLGVENWESWWQAQKPKGLPDKKAKAGGGEAAEGPSAPSGGGTRSRDLNDLNKLDPKAVVVISNDRTKIKDRPKGAPGPDGQEKSYRNYDYDHMEGILEALKIPHTVVQKQEFDKDPQSVLKSAYCILVNCSNISMQCVCDKCVPTNNAAGNRMMQCDPKCTHVNAQFCMKPESVQALKAWVEAGGYLFTEDMGVIEIIEKAWPHLVTTKMVPGADKKALQVKETTVKLAPGKGNTSHPLMRGVWARAKTESEKARESAEGGGAGGTQEKSPAKALEHKWKVDDESPSFTVVDKKLVVVLLESDELGKVAEGETAVAVTFKVGKGSTKQATGGKGSGEWAAGGGGRVLHTMSHFGKQDSSQDGQALRNLILNFLIEARKQWEARKGK